MSDPEVDKHEKDEDTEDEDLDDVNTSDISSHTSDEDISSDDIDASDDEEPPTKDGFQLRKTAGPVKSRVVAKPAEAAPWQGFKLKKTGTGAPDPAVKSNVSEGGGGWTNTLKKTGPDTSVKPPESTTTNESTPPWAVKLRKADSTVTVNAQAPQTDTTGGEQAVEVPEWKKKLIAIKKGELPPPEKTAPKPWSSQQTGGSVARPRPVSVGPGLFGARGGSSISQIARPNPVQHTLGQASLADRASAFGARLTPTQPRPVDQGLNTQNIPSDAPTQPEPATDEKPAELESTTEETKKDEPKKDEPKKAEITSDVAAGYRIIPNEDVKPEKFTKMDAKNAYKVKRELDLLKLKVEQERRMRKKAQKRLKFSIHQIKQAMETIHTITGALEDMDIQLSDHLKESNTKIEEMEQALVSEFGRDVLSSDSDLEVPGHERDLSDKRRRRKVKQRGAKRRTDKRRKKGDSDDDLVSKPRDKKLVKRKSSVGQKSKK